MDYYWLLVSEETLQLWGNEQKIAVLEWSRNYQRWELESEYLDFSSEMEGFDQDQVNQVENAAVEVLIEYCEEKMDWYQEKMDELGEI